MFKKTFLRIFTFGLAITAALSCVLFCVRVLNEGVDFSEDPEVEAPSTDTEPEYVPDLDENGVDLNIWEPVEYNFDPNALVDGKTFRFVFDTVYYEDDPLYYCFQGITYEGEKVVTVYDPDVDGYGHFDRIVTFDPSLYGGSFYSLIVDGTGEVNFSIPDTSLYVLKDGVVLD